MSKIHGYLIDLDGVIWFGERLAPGAKAFLAHCQETGTQVAFVSNTSALSRASLLNKFHRLGLSDVHAAQLFTAARVMGEHIAACKPNARVMVLGEQGTIDEMLLAGLHPVDEAADYIAISADRKITYERLTRICRETLSGAELVAANPDRHFPGEDGPLPGAGAFKAFVEWCGNKHATIVGKPSPAIFQQALAWMELEAGDVIMIGDTPEVDILGARALGIRTLLLGAHHRAAELPESMRPDMLCQDLAEYLQQI